MPNQTPADIKNAVDARLAQLWGVIQSRQDAYFQANGRFWQGLRTHTVTPNDGNTATPTVGTRTPSDLTDPWPPAIRNTPIEMALQVDAYDGPLGKGYVGTVQVTIGGRTWQRSAQVGPEVWRQRGWEEITT